MIGICTDSSSQLPDDMRERYGIEVVPLTVVVDGQEYLEGVDLDADGFWALFTADHSPEVSTGQPSPGQFALAYEQLAERGAREILSVHLSSALSGTLASARLAAHSSPVPVRLVDTGTAGFGVSLCACVAARAVAAGASVQDAAGAAESLAAALGNLFIVAGVDPMRAGGRLRVPDGDDLDGAGGRLPLFTVDGTEVLMVSSAAGMPDALETMRSYVADREGRWNAAIGMGGPAAESFATQLELAIRSARNVDEVVRYRISPSVGVHTGPGTTGLIVFPAEETTGCL